MKLVSLILALALGGLWPEVALAQQTLTVPLTEPERLQLLHGRANVNREVCRRFALPSTCTQAQACSAIGNPTNCATTPAVAFALGVRIYPLTAPGLEEFYLRTRVRPQVTAANDEAQQENLVAWCRWFRTTATQAERDQECTRADAPAGCPICP